MPDDLIEDTRVRLAAVEHVKRMSAAGVLTSDDLREGFIFEGRRIPLADSTSQRIEI